MPRRRQKPTPKLEQTWVKPLGLAEVCNFGLTEGWLLSERGDGYEHIEKDDDQKVFTSDDGAIEWVRAQACKGSVVHLFALAFHEARPRSRPSSISTSC